MKILIAYATTEGQTRKICQFVADCLFDAGHSVELIQVGADTHVATKRFDAVIFAASVHVGSYQPEMQSFARSHAKGITGQRALFIAVSLAAAGDDVDELADLDAIAARFCSDSGFAPDKVLQVAGAFRFTEYDFFKSWAMRWIAAQKGEEVDPKQDKEYTDWDALRSDVLAWAAIQPE